MGAEETRPEEGAQERPGAGLWPEKGAGKADGM